MSSASCTLYECSESVKTLAQICQLDRSLARDILARVTEAATSPVETTKANCVEPRAYLSLLFGRLPHAKSAEDCEALLPRNLKGRA